jgi:beta-lactamase class A
MVSDKVDNYKRGEVGVYIKDLQTGKTFEHHSDDAFVSASLVKLPILVAACQAIVDGKWSLNTPIKIKRSNRRLGSGELKWARVGATYPLSHILYVMITDSDNTATAHVIDYLGYDYLNDCFKKVGLDITRVNPTGLSLANRIDPALDNYTSAHEMGSLLEKIYKHQIVSDGMCDLMLEILKGANHKSRLAKSLPRHWSLARKTGLLRKNCHDVGILFSPSGDYLICVMTGRNANYRMAKSFIATLGRDAYEVLSNS